MTKVSFYHLGETEAALVPLLCSLVQGALSRGQHVLVHTANAGVAEATGALIRERLQLGAQLGTGETPRHPVSLIWGDQPGDHHGLLINLRPEIPAWFSRFEQLVELVWGNAPFVTSKRETFRMLRHRGYSVSYQELARCDTYDQCTAQTRLFAGGG